MYDMSARARLVCKTRQFRQARPFVLVIDADPRFHGNRKVDNGGHALHTLSNALGLSHQTRAKSAGLNPIAGTSDVQVNLIVTPIGTNPRALSK